MAELSALPAALDVPDRVILRSEAGLARLAAAGDERAFAAIYRRYHQELYRYCRAILGDPDDAQDALQSTMASALRALPGEERRVELRPWLYRVARNESVSILRRCTASTEAGEESLPVAPAADVSFEARERVRTLVTDLTSLPERQRSALVMRELSGLSNEQIAAALEISPGAARQVIYEARLALQELEKGRAMECEDARQAISERDGRVMRGRKLRAHLRSCEGCRDFRAGIETRATDLQLLAPPLPAVAAGGILTSLLGGASVKGGALGGLLGGGAASGGALKMAGVVAATAAIGAGAGTLAGVDPFPGGGTDRAQEREAVPPAQAPGAERAPGAAQGPASGAASGRGPGADNRPGAGDRASAAGGRGRANSDAKGSPGPPPSAPGAPASTPSGPPAGTPAGGPPETLPGGGAAGSHSGEPGAPPAIAPSGSLTPERPPQASMGAGSAAQRKPDK